MSHLYLRKPGWVSYFFGIGYASCARWILALEWAWIGICDPQTDLHIGIGWLGNQFQGTTCMHDAPAVNGPHGRGYGSRRRLDAFNNVGSGHMGILFLEEGA